MADNEAADKDLEISDEQGDEVAGGIAKVGDKRLEEATLEATAKRGIKE